MKNTVALIPLFQQFIQDCRLGKRLKKNGEKITPGTISNYTYTLNNLEHFATDTGFDLRICEANKLNKRERISEKNYWKRFYTKFTTYLYGKGCYDNYVGANIKHLRAFFNYLNRDKDFNTGNFHNLFYVRKEEIDILVLSPDRLRFLIHDVGFHQSLSSSGKKIKDAFVFGCTTGLRYSDLFRLTNKNFERQLGNWYLKLRSKKTKTHTLIKLPDYAVKIYKLYKPKSNNQPIFGSLSLFVFNRSLKLLGEKAGFTEPINVTRERLGQAKKKVNGKQLRFCDKMSSHMMRRTAITTHLILGMPEHLVRNLSGHSKTSTSFNRYVYYAQPYIDTEIEKVHMKLESF